MTTDNTYILETVEKEPRDMTDEQLDDCIFFAEFTQYAGLETDCTDEEFDAHQDEWFAHFKPLFDERDRRVRAAAKREEANKPYAKEA